MIKYKIRFGLKIPEQNKVIIEILGKSKIEEE